MVDYHAHTSRCGHASGAMEDYIESAISRDIHEMGFSDHAPLPESMRPGYTMSASQAEPYLAAISRCRERYEGRIIIRTGFEVDYPLMESFDPRYLTDPRIDYLIGSCHFIDGWSFDNPDYVDGFAVRNIDDIYARYYSIIENLAASGQFNILGHFDIVKKFGYHAARDFLPEIERIARIMSNRGTAFEVNTAGMRHPVREMYPAEGIIGIFFNANVPVTIGSDAHQPDQVGYMFSKAFEKIRNAGYRKISGFEKRKRYDIPI